MNQGTHFVGQPKRAAPEMAGQAPDHRLDHHNTHRQPAPTGHTEAHQKAVELLRTCHDVQDYAHVLHQLLHLPQKPRKGLGCVARKVGRFTP